MAMANPQSRVYVHRLQDRRNSLNTASFPLLDSDFNIVRVDRRATPDRRKSNLKLIWQENQPIRNTTELKLEFGDERYFLDTGLKKITLGRSKRADIRIDNKFASKNHAYLTYHEGEFVLQDTSLNGTFIETEELGKIRLQDQKVYLYGLGVISLGMPIDMKSVSVIRFYCR